MSSINDNKKLLQKSLVKEYIAKAEKGILDKQWEVYKEKLLDKERQNTIRNLNERQYYITFLTDLFVNVLGHKLAPDKNHNISIEEKNVSDAGRADGAIYIDDKVAAVIELKSTKTKNINEVTKQGFDYKNNHKGCRIVIISNFETLRIYVDYKIDYEEYNLFNLDKEKFYELYILLSFQGMKNGVLLDIYEKTQGNEVDITNKLYADYSAFKKALYEDIVTNNPDLDKQVLYKKTQKLIDRILFILFAERRGLLPVNTIANMLKTFEDSYKMQFCDDLYSVFKKWFGFINSGNDRMQPHIFDYNGGLFAEDDVLDNIVISDKVLKDNCNVLIKYDYESEVDVNILGHIFEQSLGENDKKKAEQNGKKKAKNNGIRNQYGIFYTAKYITHYIVENTIGKLCQEKKNELKWNELEQNIAELKGKKDNKTIKAQKREYEVIIDSYREWLLTLKILDPACGSGAFLNEALSFLIEEHKSLDELKNELATGGAGLEFTEIEKTVLEQNIFGVDINEESVEIAKLSLWLRTAKQGRKLSKLSNNIKCGNSLIRDPEVAGEKAFDWNAEFPDIMQNGGFDVVIGNPPYVRKQGLEANAPEATQYYKDKYKAATGSYDIYVLFMERALSLIKQSGEIGFILPHKFLLSEFGVGIRELFAERRLVDNIVHFGSHLVFEEASTYTCIINLNNRPKEIVKFQMMNPKELENEIIWESEEYAKLSENKWNLQDKRALSIINKMKLQPYTAADVFDRIFVGIQTGLDEVLLLTGEEVGNTIKAYNSKKKYSFEIEKEIVKPIFKGEDIGKYMPLKRNRYVVFPYKIEEGQAIAYTEDEIKAKFPKGYSYIKKFEKELRARENGRFDNDKEWFLFSRQQGINNVEQKKIMCQYLSLGSTMTYDEAGEMYHNTKVYSLIKKEEFEIDDKFYLAILNSQLMWFFMKNTSVVFRGGYYVYATEYIKPFPLPEVPENGDEYISLADEMLGLNKKLQERTKKFVDIVKADLKVELNTTKGKNDVSEMSKEDFMDKIRSKVPVNERDDWLLKFEKYKGEAKALKDEIESTDKTIDAMVYDLYGLSEDEIKIVEA